MNKTEQAIAPLSPRALARKAGFFVVDLESGSTVVAEGFVLYVGRLARSADVTAHAMDRIESKMTGSEVTP